MDAVVYPKCNDSDRQESITRSGINTRNLQITDEAGQIRQTGLTAEETRAQVSTGTTTESARADAGSLHNRFDKERVENEINLQRNVSQNFGHNVQQANGEINRHLDHLKEQLQQGKISQAEYDRQMALWQRGQVLLNSIASGLSAPTQSSAGIAANAVSPAVSYQIGQYFKELAANNRDGQLSAGQEAAHILAHTVWGAAVAHAGGNNALAGALAAGGSEAAAPIISHYLYQERDSSRLSAEQKETVTAIAGLIGTAAGAALGNTPADAAQGSLNARNSVENNFLLPRDTRHISAESARLVQKVAQLAAAKLSPEEMKYLYIETFVDEVRAINRSNRSEQEKQRAYRALLQKHERVSNVVGNVFKTIPIGHKDRDTLMQLVTKMSNLITSDYYELELSGPKPNLFHREWTDSTPSLPSIVAPSGTGIQRIHCAWANNESCFVSITDAQGGRIGGRISLGTSRPPPAPNQQRGSVQRLPPRHSPTAKRKQAWRKAHPSLRLLRLLLRLIIRNKYQLLQEPHG